MIEHLIFDFDGTISDSYPVFLKIVKRVAKEYDVEVHMSDEELLAKMRINMMTCMEAMNFSCPASERVEAFWKTQCELYLEFRPFDEIKEILERAIALGKKNYIYTHSGDIVNKMLKNMGLDSYFTYVLTSDKGFPAKPAPDALLYLTQTLDLPLDRCMMIGDRPIDTQAGNNAGIKGCLWDAFGAYPDYQTDYKITTLSELKDLIEII